MLPRAVRHRSDHGRALAVGWLRLLCLEVVQVRLVFPPLISLFVLIHLGFVLLHGAGSIALPDPLLLEWKLLPSSTDFSGNVHKGELADLRVSTQLVGKVHVYCLLTMYKRQVMCRAYKLSWASWVREGLLEDDACTASSLVVAVLFVAVLMSPEQRLIWE